MQRMILTVALGATLALCMMPVTALAQHGHGAHGHRHHHAHRPSGVYHHYQRARPYHYDLYWHGDHYDAVPHRGHHHYDYYDSYDSYRPRYGNSYGDGYYGGGVYLNGVSVRW